MSSTRAPFARPVTLFPRPPQSPRTKSTIHLLSQIHKTKESDLQTNTLHSPSPLPPENNVDNNTPFIKHNSSSSCITRSPLPLQSGSSTSPIAPFRQTRSVSLNVQPTLAPLPLPIPFSSETSSQTRSGRALHHYGRVSLPTSTSTSKKKDMVRQVANSYGQELQPELERYRNQEGIEEEKQRELSHSSQVPLTMMHSCDVNPASYAHGDHINKNINISNSSDNINVVSTLGAITNNSNNNKNKEESGRPDRM